MKPRILIVDDDEDARALYGTYLQRCAGWDVVCADNGKDALEILDSSFHAVVLDEMMPGMRGMHVLEKIRSRSNVGRICVVMLTATEDPHVIINTYAYRPNAYLSKTETGPRDLYLALAGELSNMSAAPVRPARVFLCHSHVDKPKVRELYYRLKRDFVEPWLDEKELTGGQDWDLEIRKAVKASDIVLVCLSSQVTRPGFLHKEIRYALELAEEQPEGSIFIVPLLLEPCEVPSRLARLQWINLFEEDAYDRLLRSIQLGTKALTAG
jgi:CheY-like chemotaxis protein